MNMNKLLILTSYTKFLLQIERLMSDRETFGRAGDLSVFSIPGGRSRGNQRALSANIKL